MDTDHQQTNDSVPATAHVSSQPQTNIEDLTAAADANPRPPTTTKGKKPLAQKRNASDRTSSQVWDHFEKLEGDPEAPRAACKYCKKDYACHSVTNGTSNMWAHINSCKEYPYLLDRKQKVLVLEPRAKMEGDEMGGGNMGSLKAIGLSLEECRKALAKMIIIDELPFNFVEGEGFRKFCHIMQPRFEVPSRFTVGRDCLKMYIEEKEKLKKALRGHRISLTFDTWTSIQNIKYMCLTAHWIDNGWNLHKRILNFCQVPDHKGETIGRVIESCLLDWGVEKIMTITVDNASSDNLTIRYLKQVTKDWRTDILSNECMHVRCSAHIVNLIVCEGLKDVDESVIKVRNAVRFVRSSPSRQLTFKKCSERLKIECKKSVCLDVTTRWNSTYMMLEAAEKYERVFLRLGETDLRYKSYFMETDLNGNKKNIGPPSFEDWDKARAFVKFLKLFYLVTLRFSGSLYVTSNSFFMELVSMHATITQLWRSGDYVLAEMAKKMMEKFEKYWGNENNQNFLLYVAIVLDPRFKLKYVKFCFDRMYDANKAKELTRKVEAILVRLYEHYLNDNGMEAGLQICSAETSTNQSQQNAVEVDMVDDLSNVLASQFKQHLQEQDDLESKNEVKRYLAAGYEDSSDVNFDILGWWRHHASEYRFLSKVAQHVLAIPVSTIASESAFSMGGQILDPFRSSLPPAIVQALVCCQSWLRSSPIPIDLQVFMDDVENYEKLESEFAEKLTVITDDI